MQVAEILSDLTSLRVCDHNDALTLVTVNERLPPPLSPSESEEKKPQHPGSTPEQKRGGKGDEDLQRAKELVGLHHELKARHGHGTVDEELARAREGVDRVLRELEEARWSF